MSGRFCEGVFDGPQPQDSISNGDDVVAIEGEI